MRECHAKLAGDVNGATKTALKTRYNACTRLPAASHGKTRPIEREIRTTRVVKFARNLLEDEMYLQFG